VKTAVCVAVGGALGALARYGLSHLFGDPAAGAFPIATFAANIAGSLLIGLLGGFAAILRAFRPHRSIAASCCSPAPAFSAG